MTSVRSINSRIDLFLSQPVSLIQAWWKATYLRQKRVVQWHSKLIDSRRSSWNRSCNGQGWGKEAWQLISVAALEGIADLISRQSVSETELHDDCAWNMCRTGTDSSPWSHQIRPQWERRQSTSLGFEHKAREPETSKLPERSKREGVVYMGNPK